MKTTYKSDLKRHFESVHEGIKPFKCKLCDYEAARPSQLKGRIKSAHSGIEPHSSIKQQTKVH